MVVFEKSCLGRPQLFFSFFKGGLLKKVGETLVYIGPHQIKQLKKNWQKRLNIFLTTMVKLTGCSRRLSGIWCTSSTRHSSSCSSRKFGCGFPASSAKPPLRSNLSRTARPTTTLLACFNALNLKNLKHSSTDKM